MYLEHDWAQRPKDQDEERGHEMLAGGDEGEAAWVVARGRGWIESDGTGAQVMNE